MSEECFLMLGYDGIPELVYEVTAIGFLCYEDNDYQYLQNM